MSLLLIRRIAQIRRRWRVVLVVAVLAVLAAALPSLNAHPTYVGKSALVQPSTIDLWFFDLPTAAIFLLIGMTIGGSDRQKRRQAAAGGDIDRRVPHQHG